MMDAKTRLANRERQRKYREEHREEINEQRRERYQSRISMGKCPRCGGKVKKGYTLCTTCCEYQAELNKKYVKPQKKVAAKAAAKPKTAVKKAAPKPKTAVKTAAAKPKTAKSKTKK